MPALPWLNAAAPYDSFPPVAQALREPDGLLAAGGDLAPGRLVAAYRRGIFPWFSAGEPILWWSPDPRAVIPTDALAVSRRLARTLRAPAWQVTFDTAFDAVVAACAAPRDADGGTWIVPAMARAYGDLHRLGVAHSVEVWRDEELVGGLYGVAVGRVFSGESMFSRVGDASKVAMAHLCRRLATAGVALLDGQVMSPHLQTMGAVAMPRDEFVSHLPSDDKPFLWHPRWPAS